MRISGSPLPEEIGGLLNSKFRDQDTPEDRPRFAHFEAPAGRIKRDGNVLSIHRWGFYFGDVDIIDIVVSIETDAPGTLVDQRSSALGQSGAGGLTDLDGIPISMHDICDSAFEEFLGAPPGLLRRSRFGTVASVGPDWSPINGMDNGGGLEGGHDVFFSHDRLVVRTSNPLSEVEFREYVFIAAFASRARLLHSNLNRDIRGLVRSAEAASTSARAALQVFAGAVQLERRAIIARQYFTPLDFLGVAEHVDLLDRIGGVLVMNDREWAVLEDCLAGLERYTQGLFVLTSARSQSAFNRNGLLFAGFGLLFAAVGILALFQRNQPIPIVFAAWGICLVSFLAANPMWWRAAWMSRRRRGA